jgi:uncharacterized protein DUF6600
MPTTGSNPVPKEEIVMQIQHLRFRAFAFIAGVAVLIFAGAVSADPPSRVARLGYMTGAVSFSPAGENDWVQATINRPLTTGDRLWADAGARTEIQVGGAMIRMNAATSVSVLNLDDRITQLQLAQGTLNVRVRRLEPNQVFEVDTPNLAFTLRQPGEYRITVDPDGSATEIIVRRGQGEVYGEGAAYVIDSRQPYRFMGTDLRDYQYVDAPRPDEFDRWSSDRDRSYDNSGSARYVSEDVVGYQDLDANGTWRVDATYGNVWIPNRVVAGWAPYRDGHWAWVDPWGWTWVDDAPWGFAVSHYGRWASLGGTWGWVPGPVRTRAYYAPALVVFVGGNNFQLAISGGNVGGVAWFPLGPREVYRPSYVVSRGYFENINRSNTVINTTVINNYYNNTNVTNVVYANRQVPGAVVAVPTTAFVQSQAVSKAAVRVSKEMIVSGPVAAVPSVAPTERSVRGAAGPGDKVPPPRVFERPVVARTAPPAAHVGFAAQQQQLTAKPGKPLDDATRRELKPAAAAAPAPVVKVVAPAQIAAPTLRPPPAAPGARTNETREKSDERKVPAAPATVGAPTAPTQAMPPPVPAAQPPEQRGKSEQPGKGEQRGRATAPPPPPQGAAPTPAAPPQVAPPAASAAQPTEQRGKSEQRGKGEQREQPVTPPPAPPQGAAPRQVTPQQVAPPVPDGQPPEQRGMSEQRGKGEQRGQPVAPPPPPPQRATEPKAIPPQVAPPPPPATQPPPQRSVQPNVAPPPQIAPPAPAPQQPPQRARPEPEQRPPAAAPKPPPPQTQSAPKAEPPGQERKPAAGKPDDKKKDSDEQKREEENRKQKG